MPRRKDTETIGTLVKKVIDEGCEELGITRGDLAEQIGMHRVSLYNLLRKPGGISLQSLVNLMDAVKLPPDRQGYLVYKWCEDRTESNHFAEILFPVLEELCREYKIESGEMGSRVLAVYRKQSKKKKK